MEPGECEVVRRLVEEVANGGRMTLIDELVAGDFREHAGPPGLPSDREVLKQSLASRWIFGDSRAYAILGLESRDGTVVLNLGERNGEAQDQPQSLEGLGTGSSSLPSREKGLENYPSPSEKEGCRILKIEEHKLRVVEGKISEHWGVKPLFSTPRQ